jgi:hypothetical protein
MGTAGWAQAEADRARIRTVLRAPPDWRAPATTSLPASTTKHGAAGAPIAALAHIARTGGYALDPPWPRAGEQAETIAKHGSRMRIHAEAEATQSAQAIDATARRSQPVLLQRKCACGAGASSLTGECAECSRQTVVGLQTKLRINEPGDVYEQEADRVAEQVLAKPTCPHVSGAPPRIQRFSGQSSGQTGAAPASVDRALASPGRPLEPVLRQDMEQRFGHDFSRVRVHSDAASEISARQVNAHAYASGYDIVFGAGRFAPATPAGRRLLAHELTHVVQQTRETDGLQTKLIQRDGPKKAGDVTQEEKEALINFKNDWENNFSHYDKLITISGRSYDKTQKEAIKAVKTSGNSISIILGKPYATEMDEQTRWQWIKAEVIDKNIKTDKFEEVAYDPTHSKLKEIGPPHAAGQYCTLNCPATAASLDHYLRTGNVSPAVCNRPKETTEGYGFDISMNTFSTSVSWDKAEATIKQQLKKHGDFVIVEGTRSEKQMNENNLAKTHYFSVVNVKGQLFAIDAFGGGIVSDSIPSYIKNRVIATTYRIVKGEFKVKEVIPK